MDLRVYVDGVARIICDLTRTTTVHDIIIALAQYKGKAGRYSLIQSAPDGTQRTLSPNELTSELIHHSDWIYILQQNPSYAQKRSKSLDGRKTPIHDKFSPVTSSTDHIRTVEKKKIPNGFATLSSTNKKRSNIHQTIPSRTINQSSPLLNSFENHQYSRARSAFTENSAFHITSPHPQYLALLQLLKNQEIRVQQQATDLTEKQKEIDYREVILQQAQLYQDSIQHELQSLEEHDRHLFSECQLFAQEYSSEKFDLEFEYQQTLHSNYEHLQQQLARCTSTLEQKRQLQEQLQLNIEQTHEYIQQLQTNFNNDKKEIIQCEYDLNRSNSSFKKHEDLEYIYIQRNEDLEYLIQQHQKQILELELELIQLDDLLINMKK